MNGSGIEVDEDPTISIYCCCECEVSLVAMMMFSRSEVVGVACAQEKFTVGVPMPLQKGCRCRKTIAR